MVRLTTCKLLSSWQLWWQEVVQVVDDDAGTLVHMHVLTGWQVSSMRPEPVLIAGKE